MVLFSSWRKKWFSSSHLVSVVHAKIKTYVAKLAVDSDSDPKAVPVTINYLLAKRRMHLLHKRSQWELL